MKALVTGANGFTGSHLVKELISRGFRVRCLVRKNSNLDRIKSLNLELFYGDISDSVVLYEAMEGVDFVFHLAAYVELGLVDEMEMERVNVLGTKTVLETAVRQSVSRLIYCSTVGIFGDTRGEVIDETFKRQQTYFSSAYDRTKYQAQQLVDQFAEEGLPVISIMPSGIFGIDDPHFGPVFKLFLSKKLRFWIGGDRLTGIVAVDDLVSAMLLAVEKGKIGDYYIVSSGELTLNEMFIILSQETGISPPKEIPKVMAIFLGFFLESIGKALNWNPPISRERLHYIYDRCVRVSSNKARSALDWIPISPEECIVKIIRELNP